MDINGEIYIQTNELHWNIYIPYYKKRGILKLFLLSLVNNNLYINAILYIFVHFLWYIFVNNLFVNIDVIEVQNKGIFRVALVIVEQLC